MRITVLGCGNSGGVPVIGCDCPVCRSAEPKNKRTRVSILIEINNINILIDTSPDLHQQAIRHDIRRVDAVLYTHDHADHTHGIDELRAFNYMNNKEIPIYGDKATINTLQQRFPYVFLTRPSNIWFRPSLEPRVIAEGAVTPFGLDGVTVTAFEQIHGKNKTLGYRIGNFAYSTDTNKLPETAFDALKELDLWVVDCLRYTEAPTHSHLAQTLEWIRRVKPKRAVLTHLSHDFDYAKLSSELPDGIEPGYDGLTVDI